MNALMRLNQIRPGLQYRLLSQSGPVHAPVFTMSVDLDGTIYEASGSSKKTAKLHVAVKVRRQMKETGWRVRRVYDSLWFRSTLICTYTEQQNDWKATWKTFEAASEPVCIYKYVFVYNYRWVCVCVCARVWRDGGGQIHVIPKWLWTKRLSREQSRDNPLSSPFP